MVTRVVAWKMFIGFSFWLHVGYHLGLLGFLGMILMVPCALRVAWIHFGGVLNVKWLPRGSILRVLGSVWASFWLPFEGPRAPGHASGGFLCPRGGLDHF